MIDANLFLGVVDSPYWDTNGLRVQRDKMIVSTEAARAIWFLCQQPVSGVVNETVLQPFNHWPNSEFGILGIGKEGVQFLLIWDNY